MALDDPRLPTLFAIFLEGEFVMAYANAASAWEAVTKVIAAEPVVKNDVTVYEFDRDGTVTRLFPA